MHTSGDTDVNKSSSGNVISYTKRAEMPINKKQIEHFSIVCQRHLTYSNAFASDFFQELDIDFFRGRAGEGVNK